MPLHKIVVIMGCNRRMSHHQEVVILSNLVFCQNWLSSRLEDKQTFVKRRGKGSVDKVIAVTVTELMSKRGFNPMLVRYFVYRLSR